MMVCGTIIVVTIVNQWGRTKRAEILTEKVSSQKKEDIIGKQLEEELGDRSENKNDVGEKVIETIMK